MLQQAHFSRKGGKETFAAGANKKSVSTKLALVSCARMIGQGCSMAMVYELTYIRAGEMFEDNAAGNLL